MSELKVDKITPRQGTTLTLGDTGDTINFGSGVLPNFENLTVTGDLTVDTNSLKVDSTNNFVGIGTASPSVALDVVGAITATGNITGTLATAAQPNITSVGTLTSATVSGDLTVDTNTLYVDSADNRVGILTTNPFTPLHIQKSALTGFISRTASNLTLESSGGNEIYFASGDSSYGQIRFGDTASTYSGGFQYEHSTDTMLFQVNGSEAMRIDSSGTVAINQTSPSSTYKLDVNGKIRSTGNSPEFTLREDDASNQTWLMASYGGTFAVRDTTVAGTTYPLQIEATTPSNTLFLDSSGNVGIGTSSPSGNLVVQTSAVRSANSNYNQIVAENNGNSGVSILSGTTSQGGLVFGDVDSNNIASVRYNHSADEMLFDVNGSRALTIDSSGDFGIGTSSINVSGLEISRATGSASPTPVELRLTTGTNASDWSTTSPYARISFYSNDTSSGGPKIMNTIETITTTTTGGISNLVFKSRTNKLLELNEDISYFYTGNTERMRIDSSGNVGIGTSSPSQKLEVSGNILLGDNNNLYLGTSGDLAIYHNGSHSFIDEQGTGNLYIRAYGSLNLQKYTGENMIVCNADGNTYLYYDNSEKLRTTGSGVTVTGTLTETSSIAYKENIQPLEFNEAIYNVNAVKYDRKDGSSKDEVGVIAEELYEILPDLVETKEGKPDSVKYTKLTMYLLEALKKQNEEIQELKKRLN